MNRRIARGVGWHVAGSPLRWLPCALALLLLGLHGARGQEPAPLFTAGKDAAEIPCELAHNLIFVPVSVNGSGPLSFILDTGAGMTVLNARSAKALNLKTKGNIPVSGNGPAQTEAALIGAVALSLPGVESFSLPMLSLSLDSVEALMGRTIDGILGYDFFLRFVVEADYVGRTIRLFDPARPPRAEGESLALQMQGNRPFVRARVTPPGRKPLEGTFLIDTGYNSAVHLAAPFVTQHKLIATVPKTYPSYGAGVGGGNAQFAVRFQNFRIGDFSFPNPVITLSQAMTSNDSKGSSAGMIGGDILRRFRIVFDYAHLRMTLKQSAIFGQPLDYDMSGIWLTTVPGNFHQFRVINVVQNSAGAKAGVRPGDIITALDGKPADALTLDQIRQIFLQNGRECVLDLRRGTETLQFHVRLRRLF